ncbi:beta-N-acetylhexosaminidase [Halobacillus litoralis]|uniref:beta-N-acetylhexosaminidase n=1 Tax=Halobacillus litoralis TaxID=45668 RepID=UPI0024925D85|nr:beta-N-acetylhexosaminidase [Halobacillus litoralis]
MKKFLYIALFFTLLLTIFLLYFNDSPQNTGESNADDTQNEQDEEKIEPATDVNNIIQQAKDGKVPGSSVTAGETKLDSLKSKWGEPEQITQTSRGHYGAYPDQQMSIGYSDGLIFDVRYSGKSLATIHLNDIKKVQGEPDQVNYYKDDSHDQIILIYPMNQTYQLKWVLKKPTNDEKNPPVDHISVVTEPQNDVQDKISSMSLKEKIGQMIIAGFTGTTINEKTKDLIRNQKVGGLIFYSDNVASPSQTVQLVNEMKEANEVNETPLFLSIDQEGGSVSRLPGQLLDLPTNGAVGNVGSSQFSYGIGEIIGKQLKQFGFNLNYSPVMDVNSNPDNPVIGDRSFSGDPQVVSQLGIQKMKGIKSQQIIPVIKHFPGHGDTSVDSHLQLPQVSKSLEQLKNLELIPFENAIEKGAEVVMVAHILLPELDRTLPASMSEKIISGLLREQLGYEGIVITDDMTMKAVTNNFSLDEASVDSVKAGSDIILVAHDYNKVEAVINALTASVERGEISEERINQSVERILKLKNQYQLNGERVDEVNVNQLNESIRSLLEEY